jgi:predicted ferric reductase
MLPSPHPPTFANISLLAQAPELLQHEQLWWWVARSGGIVALVLTGLAVIWGLALSTKVMQGTPTPKWLLSLHRWLGGLSVTFTGVHVAALVLDSYVHFGVAEILVPFASDWKPGAVAWGVVSMYLLVAVQLTSLMMRRIPRTWWKRVHMTSWVLFWTGLIHGVTAGTDASHPLYVAVTALMTLLVVFLTTFRILASRRRPRRTSNARADAAPAVQ